MRVHRLRNSVQIAVIGGNGFVGRAIIKRLSSFPNLRVFSIDKKHNNVTIDTSESKAIIQQIKMDISADSCIQSWLISNPVDGIIYCAGYEAPTDGLQSNIEDDLKATLGLHHTLTGLGRMDLDPQEEPPYFLYVSSWTVYGPQKRLITEETKEFPGSFTGMNKLASEDLVKRLCAKHKAQYCIVRPSEIYGRRHNNELSNKTYWPGYVSFFVEKLVKKYDEIPIFSPKTRLDLVNVNYVSKFIVECVRNKTEGIFNISSGETISMADLAALICDQYGRGEMTGKLVKTNSLQLENMVLDPSKAHSLVPYEERYRNLESFVKDYIAVRRYEVGKNMAIEQVMSEPVILDAAALRAKEALEERREKRKLAYEQIKKIAGPEFFKIKIGRLQERSQKVLEHYEEEKLLAEKTSSPEELRKQLLLESNAVEILKLKKGGEE